MSTYFQSLRRGDLNQYTPTTLLQEFVERDRMNTVFRSDYAGVTRSLQTFTGAPAASEEQRFSLDDLRETFRYLDTFYSSEQKRSQIIFFNIASRAVEKQIIEESPGCPPRRIGPLSAQERQERIETIRAVLSSRRPETGNAVDRTNYQRLVCAFRDLTHGSDPYSWNRDALHELLQPTGRHVGRGSYGSLNAFHVRLPRAESSTATAAGAAEEDNEQVAIKNLRISEEALDPYRPAPAELTMSFEPIIHETFIATEGIRRIYNSTSCPPVFAVSWGYADCGNANGESAQPRAWCANAPGAVGVQEMYRGSTVNSFLSNAANVRLRDLLAVYILVADGLNTAFRTIRFSHRDLHAGNVLLIDPAVNLSPEIEGFDMPLSFGARIRTRFVPKIIDYGASRMELDGFVFGNFNGPRFGIRCCPFGDLSLFLMTSLARLMNNFPSPDTSMFVDEILAVFTSITSEELDAWLGRGFRAARAYKTFVWANTVPVQFDNVPLDSIIARFLQIYARIESGRTVSRAASIADDRPLSEVMGVAADVEVMNSSTKPVQTLPTLALLSAPRGSVSTQTPTTGPSSSGSGLAGFAGFIAPRTFESPAVYRRQIGPIPGEEGYEAYITAPVREQRKRARTSSSSSSAAERSEQSSSESSRSASAQSEEEQDFSSSTSSSSTKSLRSSTSSQPPPKRPAWTTVLPF